MRVGSDDPTTGHDLASWVPVTADSDFPIQNLPYGIVQRSSPLSPPSVAVAIGDQIVDLAVLHGTGLLDVDPPLPPGIFTSSSLNTFMARGPAAWQAVRRRVSSLLRDADCSLAADSRLRDAALAPGASVTMRLPFDVGDYVDFYSSLEHATNLGRILRPDGDPLPANWRYLPMGYHGRSGTIVVSGTPIRRPCGLVRGAGAEPIFEPTSRLDFELEVGFVCGVGSAHARPVPIADAAGHVFGMVLLNDWSARDIQAFEYQPLGPFLGKSFATSISPWVVSLDALDPYRVSGPAQRPAVADYLRLDQPWAFDIDLEVWLESERMRVDGNSAIRLSRTNLRHMYWSMPQQLAHLTANGASVRPGDLLASGTVSGEQRASWGSLIELAWNGTRPLTLPSGESRAFLEDGDTVTMRAWAHRPGLARIGFGALTGTIVPALRQS
jgi:fumarylacetoacetase